MTKMAEAEVSLRFAEWLLARPGAKGEAVVAIDGAQVRVRGAVIFPIEDFMLQQGWRQVEQLGKNEWQGTYERGGKRLVLHARSGLGDVVAHIGDARVRAECKGGALGRPRASKEYPKLREALGQLITAAEVEDGDVMVAVVPDGARFRDLAVRWREAPLVQRSGIRIALVAEDGKVDLEI